MPNAVLEAFACGVPSVLTPFIGLPAEFGRPGEQYVLTDRQPAALSDAIAGLLGDSERRRQLGKCARGWVEERMGVDASLDQYAELYRELVAMGQRTLR